ncbi:Heat shock protein, mitochondrial [Glycine soja]
MASSLILKRFVYSSVLSCKSPTLLRPAASASHRSFNDHADDNDDRGSRSGTRVGFEPGSEHDESRRGWEWDAKETKDVLLLRVNMPGLGKEHVKISVEQNTLASAPPYTCKIDLPVDKLYKFDQIKAEMNNGVLHVVVPKKKEEETKDATNVKFE